MLSGLVAAPSLRLECARVLNEVLYVPVLLCMREKEKSRIRSVQRFVGYEKNGKRSESSGKRVA